MHHFDDNKKIIEGAAVVKISKQIIKHEISPLVSVLRGQDGCLSKQNFMRNSNFKVSSSNFQSKFNKPQKTTQKWCF